MGVCSAVRDMALAIDSAFGDEDPDVRSAAQVLASMPDWLEQDRLDLWEERFKEVVPLDQVGGLAMSLVERVFEFGELNLYTAFNTQRTAEEYDRLMAVFAQHGLVLERHHHVSDW